MGGISRGARTRLESLVSSTILFRLTHPRKTHLYGVGTGKSGTHSLAAIFSDSLRVAHEPERFKLINVILATAAGRLKDEQLRRNLLKRDRRLWLEVDSSQLNFFLLDKLLALFPDAKFILTIRDPYAWLDSTINHQLGLGRSEKWIQLHDLRYRPDLHAHTRLEDPLKEKGLYSLDGYLAYWANHIRTVINSVSKDRLLVIRTDQLSDSMSEIAKFAGVPRSSLNEARSHTFKAHRKFHVLRELDQTYLADKLAQHCGELLGQFFPEMQRSTGALPFQAVDTLSDL